MSCFSFSVSVCMTEHPNRTLRSTALNAHGTMPAMTGSVHAYILTRPSRAGFAVRRSELIEPGAATCVQRRGWAVFKRLGTYVSGTSTV